MASVFAPHPTGTRPSASGVKDERKSASFAATDNATGAGFATAGGRACEFPILADVGVAENSTALIDGQVVAAQPRPIAFDDPDAVICWSTLFHSKPESSASAFSKNKGAAHKPVCMQADAGALRAAVGETTRILITNITVKSATVYGAPPVPFKFSMNSRVGGGGSATTQWFTKPSVAACCVPNSALRLTGAGGLFAIGGTPTRDTCVYQIDHTLANDPWWRVWARLNTQRIARMMSDRGDTRSNTITLGKFGRNFSAFGDDDQHAAASALASHIDELDITRAQMEANLDTESTLVFPHDAATNLVQNMGSKLRSASTELYVGDGSALTVCVQPATTGGWSDVADAQAVGLASARGVIGGASLVAYSCTVEFHGLRLD